MDLSFGASVSTDLHSAEHQGPRLPVMHVPAALRREGKKNGSRLLRPCVTRYKLSLRLEISDFVILTKDPLLFAQSVTFLLSFRPAFLVSPLFYLAHTHIHPF